MKLMKNWLCVIAFTCSAMLVGCGAAEEGGTEPAATAPEGGSEEAAGSEDGSGDAGSGETAEEAE